MDKGGETKEGKGGAREGEPEKGSQRGEGREGEIEKGR